MTSREIKSARRTWRYVVARLRLLVGSRPRLKGDGHFDNAPRLQAYIDTGKEPRT